MKKLAPATVNLTIGLVSTIFNIYIKKGGKITNPVKGIININLIIKEKGSYLEKYNGSLFQDQ